MVRPESGEAFRLRIVPRSPLSTQLQPIRQKVRFLAQPGTSDHDALREFWAFGEPFVGFRAEIIEAEGPPGTTETGTSILSLYVGEHEALPPMELVLVDEAQNALAPSALP